MSDSRGRGRGRGGRGDVSLPHHPRGGGGGGGGGGRGDRGGGFRGDRGGGFRGDRGGGGRGDRGGGGRGRGGPMAVEIFQSAAGTVPEPDQKVKQIENETESQEKQLRSKPPSAKGKASLEPQHPLRPGFGTKGRAVTLWTNYFRLTMNGELLLHRYNIALLGNGDGRGPTGKKLKRIIELLIEENFSENQRDIVSDFKSNLLSKQALELEEEYRVVYRIEGEDDPAANARTYTIRLLPTGSLTVSQLTEYLTSTNAGQIFGAKEETIQALNIVIGNHPKTAPNVVSIGANRHYPLNAAHGDKFDLGAGLTALRGFFVSVRAATSRVLVNIQVKHAAFYADGPLDQLMAAFATQYGPNPTRLASFLKRLSVDVIHITKQNKAGRRVPRIKTIQDVARPGDGRGQEHPPRVASTGAGSRDVQFFLSSAPSTSDSKPKGGKKGKGKAGPSKAEPSGSSSRGEYISVFDYFKRNYPQYPIKNPRLPVVNVGTRDNPSYMPPDVCMVLPGQASRAKLSPSQTQQMIKFAVRKPALNAQSIVASGPSMLGLKPANATLDSFGCVIDTNMITVPGRVLNAPAIKYHANRIANPRFGSWNLADNVKFSTGAALTNWTYLWISGHTSRDPWRDENDLKVSVDAFARTLRDVGIQASQCAFPGTHINVDPDNPAPQVDEAVRRLKADGRKLILVITPGDASIYSRVKYACDVKEGLLNVCVIASKFARANAQYLANVALKVNLKLGGRNQLLDNTKLGIVAEGKTMIVGIDVTHPAPGASSNAPSVAGIVASVDQFLAHWPADLRIQTRRQEMVADLEDLFKSRLRLWKGKHGAYPENIIIYRDGVSEGQYNLVLEQELPALRKACEALYPAPSTKQGQPRMTIAIVGKRHHTRFYATRADDADRSSNPSNGTVVDRGVTEARNWDFFLQAHAAIQGTARPAHYYVIYDQIFRSPAVTTKLAPNFANSADAFEDLTHNLCYLFGRATKAVSICPPAYYADMVCERARLYLGGLLDASSGAASAVSSQTGAGAGGADQPPGQERVTIHPSVKDSMFYI